LAENTNLIHPHPNPPPSRGREFWTFCDFINFRTSILSESEIINIYVTDKTRFLKQDEQFFLIIKTFWPPMQIKNPASIKEAGFCDKINSGGVLLSHAVARIVPSALPGLTSEFGLGSGAAYRKNSVCPYF